MSMLMTEWNMEDALAVRFEEGMERGMKDAARKALAEGASVEFVKKITGLDEKALNDLREESR